MVSLKRYPQPNTRDLARYMMCICDDQFQDNHRPSRILLLAVSVHAVLLKSGFVRLDPSRRAQIDGFEWPRGSPKLIVFYTLPQILARRNSSSPVSQANCVRLKFKRCGEGDLSVDGCLALALPAEVKKLLLSSDKITFDFLHFMMMTKVSDRTFLIRTAMVETPDPPVFKLWEKVEKKLALPLLTELCTVAGLEPPGSFMKLPDELKLKILELLPGDDIARMSSLCKELWKLVSGDPSWRQKHVVKPEVEFLDPIFDLDFSSRDHYSIWFSSFSPEGPDSIRFPGFFDILDYPAKRSKYLQEEEL